MKIGFHANLRDLDVYFYPLWIINYLVGSTFKTQFNDQVPLTFEFTFNDEIYKFSDEYHLLNDCDIKIKLTRSLEEYDSSDKNLYDKFIYSVIETIAHNESDEKVLFFLNSGNYILGSCKSNITHKNLIFNPYFALMYYYYIHGYFFINYYQNTCKKENLLGMYHRPFHIQFSPHPRRNYIFDKIKNILNEDFVVYKNYVNKITPVIEKSIWNRNNITNYTDFSSSVCNIIFETFDSVGTWSSDNRISITEKTLKAILYSKELIFFLWYGSHVYYNFLKNNGFWFLNFEFIDMNLKEKNENFFENYEETFLGDSIYKTVEYLKILKNDLGSNEKVYEYLINKYRDKLENNYNIFMQVVNNYPELNNLIEIFK